MADNVTLSAGTADGAVIATDDDGTAQHQYVKLEFGADNTQTKVSSAAPLPVQISDGTDTALVDGSGNLNIVGTVTANLGATDNAVLDAIVSALGGTLTVSGTVDLGATDNAVLDAIAASVAAIDIDATTIIGHVDGIETVLGTIDTDTGNIATAAQLLDDTVYVDDADWTDGTSKHLLTGGLYQSTPQTVTDGDVAPFNITANGALHVAQQGTVTVDGSGVTQPVSGTVTANLGATDNAVLDDIASKTGAAQTALETAGGLVVNLGANNDVTVTGTVDLGATDNAVLDAIAASLALLDNSIATGNELHVDVVGALPAGTNAIGKLAANSGVDIGDVDVTSISAGSNLIGNVGVGVRTSGGMSMFKSIDIDESEEEVKATAGQVYSISAFNHTAAPIFLKFYNLTAANTTVGTSTPVLTFTVPGNADSDGAGFVWNNPIGFAFSTAISVAATTAIADADTGAPAGNACSVLIGSA